MHLFILLRRISASQYSFFALLFSFFSSCFAQANDDRSLIPVVVTASRIEQLQTDALPHTTVITAETIRKRQATDVVTVLRNEAGIDIIQNGGPNTATSLFMRGTNANQFLLLLDGVPIRDATSIGMAAPLQHILADQIDRIEIVRGNVSAIYGSGAIGGVIQIFTKQGTGKPSVSFTTELGSRGTTKVGAGVSGKSNNTRYMLSATRFDTNGFSVMNTKQYPDENPDKDGSRNLSVTGAVSHEWSKGNELGVRFYIDNARFDYDGAGGGLPTQIDYGKTKQETFAAFSKNRLTSDWLSTVTVSETNIRRHVFSYGGWTDTEDHFKSDTSALQWGNEIILSSDWIATAGLNLSREKADVRGYFNFEPSRSSKSVYAGLNGKSGPHSAQLNARYDHVSDSGSDTTGYLGYGYAFTPSWKFIASTSTAFLAPTLYQLYLPQHGNPDLKAEKAYSHEIGLQYTSGHTFVRASLFDSKIRDQIDYTNHYVNVGKAKIRGFELSAAGRYADIDLKASLTLQNPENDTTGETLLRRAKRMASVVVSKTIGPWLVGGDIRYTGRRPDLVYVPYPGTSYKTEMPSYWVANFNMRYQVNKDLSLYGRIENLFNRDYQAIYGYDQPPRGVFVGLNWKS